MKNILIYGGSFNPPTLAHAALIDAAINDLDYDEIWLMPSKDRADKQIGIDGNFRLRMLRALVSDFFSEYKKQLKIVDFELKLKGQTQTANTMELMAKKYPQDKFTWLIGADSWVSMESWKNGAKIKKEANWVVVERSGYEVGNLPANIKKIRGLFDSSLSSTIVRDRIAKHISALPYVPRGVNQIIIKNNLYR